MCRERCRQHCRGSFIQEYIGAKCLHHKKSPDRFLGHIPLKKCVYHDDKSHVRDSYVRKDAIMKTRLSPIASKQYCLNSARAPLSEIYQMT